MLVYKSFRIWIIILIISLNVGCDQISKSIVRNNVSENEYIPLIKGYFTLTKIENAGAFLSLGDTLPGMLRFILLTLLPVIILIIGTGFLLYKRELPKLLVVGFSFVIGGGIGNLFDRLSHGSVTDFLHIDFVLFQTGIFNMADVAIMTGMGFVILESFVNRKSGVKNS